MAEIYDETKNYGGKRVPVRVYLSLAGKPGQAHTDLAVPHGEINLGTIFPAIEQALLGCGFDTDASGLHSAVNAEKANYTVFDNVVELDTPLDRYLSPSPDNNGPTTYLEVNVSPDSGVA